MTGASEGRLRDGTSDFLVVVRVADRDLASDHSVVADAGPQLSWKVEEAEGLLLEGIIALIYVSKCWQLPNGRTCPWVTRRDSAISAVGVVGDRRRHLV